MLKKVKRAQEELKSIISQDTSIESKEKLSDGLFKVLEAEALSFMRLRKAIQKTVYTAYQAGCEQRDLEFDTKHRILLDKAKMFDAQQNKSKIPRTDHTKIMATLLKEYVDKFNKKPKHKEFLNYAKQELDPVVFQKYEKKFGNRSTVNSLINTYASI